MMGVRVTIKRDFRLVITVFILFLFRFSCLATDSEVPFGNFLNIFSSCDIHLYNYRNIPLSITGIPMVVYGDVPFQIKREEETRSHCLAVFYLMPTSKRRPDRDRGGRRRDDLYSRGSQMLTSFRYDILLEQGKKGGSQQWMTQYKDLYESGTSSHGLLLTIKEPRFFKLTADTKVGNLRIVRKLQFAKGLQIATSVDLNTIMSGWGKFKLDQAIEKVNSLTANADVGWKLNSPDDLMLNLMDIGGFDNFRDNNALIEFLSRRMSRGNPRANIWKRMQANGVSLELLIPRSVSTEGIENYAFAYMALGPNITLQEDDSMDGWNPQADLPPTITFGAINGRYMRDTERRRLGFISCATTSQKRERHNPSILMSFLAVAVEYMSIFELKVYIAIIVTYVVPSLILGLFYHCLIKKRLPKKIWIKWHPFTWGIRALIWQSGDRRWHSKRFGFMAWLAGPWALMSVVISYAFRGGGNQGTLSTSSEYMHYHRSVRLEDLEEAGVTVVTDHPTLTLEMSRAPWLDGYRELAKFIYDNTSIVYLTWWDRIERVENQMRGRCRNWMSPKKGQLWYPPRSLRMWQSQEVFWGDGPSHGWKIERWGDDKLIERIKKLSEDSDIVPKMRRLIAESGTRGGRMVQQWYNYRVIMPMSMMSNVKYLYLLGFAGLLLGLVIWLLENIFGRIVMRLWRGSKWGRKSTDAGKEVTKEGSENDSSTGGSEDIRNLIVEKVEMIEGEQKRNSSATSDKLQVVLIVDRKVDVTEQIFEVDEVEEGKKMEMVAVVEIVQNQHAQGKDSLDLCIDRVEVESEGSSIELELEILEVRSDVDLQENISVALELEENENEFDFPTVRSCTSTPEPAIISTTVSVHVSAEEIDGKKNV